MSSSPQEIPGIIIESLGSSESKKNSFLFTSLNPLINIPIAQRLILGFLIPALIATFASSLVGMQSAQLLKQESSFYQNLFQGYASLTTGNDFLQLMNFKLNGTLSDALATDPQQEQLKLDREAIQNLEGRYDTTLNDYIKKGLLIYNPEQAKLFETAGYPGQDAQQRLLANSALRTWQLYRKTQDQILKDIQSGNYQDASDLEHSQGETTFSDTLSALRQLIQFNGRLVTYVQGATAVQESNVLITTVIAVILVLLSIGLLGVLTYATLVNRLRRLREVAQTVQRGKTDTRAIVDGQDEITAVSRSMNTMLDTIVGLLKETQVQRDALVQAAERLFSDMRLANNGEFDIKSAVNNDPIAMLGHAFNFTIGRFQRFLLRNRTTVEQLDLISLRNLEHTESFLVNARNLLQNPQNAQLPAGSSLAGLSSQSAAGLSSQPMRNGGEQGKPGESAGGNQTELMTQATKIQQYVQQTLRQDIEQTGFHLLTRVERAYRLCRHVESELQAHRGMMTASNFHELRSLETQLTELRQDTQTFQKKASEDLAEMDTRIKSFLTVTRSIDLPRSTSHLSATQIQEITRLVERFAQDTTALAQSLRGITQEMRASLAPFRSQVIEEV